MKIEEYINPFNKKIYVRVGIVGVLKERLEIFNTRFESFQGEPEFGWWKIKVSGIEGPIQVSDQWMMSQPTKLIEGEELEILLDKIDNKAWKIARVSPAVASEGNTQTEQAGLQTSGEKAEATATNQETIKKQQWL